MKNKQTAIITGGSRGVGRSIVLYLVAKGLNIAFTYRDNKDSAEETVQLAQKENPHSKIKAYQLNQKDFKQVETVSNQIIEDFKNVHVLINNAAIVKNNAAVLMTPEEWEDVIATNLSGPFYLIHSFLMHFISNHYGRIINISSLAQDGASGQANYAASKAGLVGLTKSLSREYGAKGIRSNVISIGYVETDMSGDHMSEDLRKAWIEYCPIKKTIKGKEIASMVHYLTTKDANFINGEVIRIAGGLSYVP